jgi:hypothetical protein
MSDIDTIGIALESKYERMIRKLVMRLSSGQVSDDDSNGNNL